VSSSLYCWDVLSRNQQEDEEDAGNKSPRGGFFRNFGRKSPTVSPRSASDTPVSVAAKPEAGASGASGASGFSHSSTAGMMASAGSSSSSSSGQAAAASRASPSAPREQHMKQVASASQLPTGSSSDLIAPISSSRSNGVSAASPPAAAASLPSAAAALPSSSAAGAGGVVVSSTASRAGASASPAAAPASASSSVSVSSPTVTSRSAAAGNSSWANLPTASSSSSSSGSNPPSAAAAAASSSSSSSSSAAAQSLSLSSGVGFVPGFSVSILSAKRVGKNMFFLLGFRRSKGEDFIIVPRAFQEFRDLHSALTREFGEVLVPELKKLAGSEKEIQVFVFLVFVVFLIYFFF